MNGTSVSQEQLVSQIVESRQRYNTKRNEWIQMMNESESNGDIAFAIQAGVEVVNLERLYGHGDKARTMVDRVCGLIKGNFDLPTMNELGLELEMTQDNDKIAQVFIDNNWTQFERDMASGEKWEVVKPEHVPLPRYDESELRSERLMIAADRRSSATY